MGRPPKDHSQALRLLKMLDMLQHHGALTIRRLTDEFGVDRRTIQRDLNVVREVVRVEEGDRNDLGEKVFRLAPDSRGETIRLTITEMIALYLSMRTLEFLRGTDLKRSIDSVYDKLKTRISARTDAARERLGEKFFCTAGAPKSYRAKDDRLNDILTGLIDDKKLAITYQRPGGQAYDVVVHPYTLVLHQGALYLVCYSERAGDFRTLAVERILRTRWRGMEGFTYKKGYRPQKYLGDAFGITGGDAAEPVRLRFTKETAPYVKARHWHPSMKLKDRPGGAVELTLKVAITEELLQWVTGYGRQVRVLAPPKLKESIAQRHREAAAQYR